MWLVIQITFSQTPSNCFSPPMIINKLREEPTRQQLASSIINIHGGNLSALPRCERLTLQSQLITILSYWEWSVCWNQSRTSKLKQIIVKSCIEIWIRFDCFSDLVWCWESVGVDASFYTFLIPPSWMISVEMLLEQFWHFTLLLHRSLQITLCVSFSFCKNEVV